MAMVRFATTCDHCGRRSAEYTAWPTCGSCGDEVCDQCGRIVWETDGTAPDIALCKKCEREGYTGLEAKMDRITKKLIERWPDDDEPERTDGYGQDSTPTKDKTADAAKAMLDVLKGDEDLDRRQTDLLQHFTAGDNMYHMKDASAAKVYDAIKALEDGYRTWNRVRMAFLNLHY